jgi:hypothetical protein
MINILGSLMKDASTAIEQKLNWRVRNEQKHLNHITDPAERKDGAA